MSATAIPLNIPDQLEGLLNLELDFSSDFEKGRFAGEIEVVDALYYKDINLFGNVFESSAPRIVKSFSDGKKLPDISLDLKLKSRRDIVMDNNLGFIELKPDIQVKGDISAPLISGRALIRENGFLMFQKKTFTIKKGVLDFEPVYGMLPTADIQSETEVGIYKIFLSVTEDLSNPKFTLTSFPAESDADILSILIFGRKASELAGQGDGQPVSKEKLIADWLSGSYSEKVADKTGLDYIEVNVPDDFSASAPSGYGLTVGKKISDRLILKYSLVNNGSEMIQKGSADYQMFENIIFSGFRSTDGSFGAETQFRKEFR
jgi:translocation and assembly module TamB